MDSVHIRNYLMIGVATYLLVLIASFPAGVAWGFLSTPSNPVSLETSGSTLWKGQDKLASYAETTHFILDWQWNPWALFKLQFGYHMNVDFAGDLLEADVGWRPSSLDISSTHGTLDLENLLALLSSSQINLPVTVKPTGQLVIEELNVELQENWPDNIEGSALIQNLQFTGLDLRDWEGKFSSGENNQIKASFQDIDSPIDGEVNVELSNSGSINISWSLRATDNAPENIINSLALLGQANGEGYRTGSFTTQWQ